MLVCPKKPSEPPIGEIYEKYIYNYIKPGCGVICWRCTEFKYYMLEHKVRVICTRSGFATKFLIRRFRPRSMGWTNSHFEESCLLSGFSEGIAVPDFGSYVKSEGRFIERFTENLELKDMRISIVYPPRYLDSKTLDPPNK